MDSVFFQPRPAGIWPGNGPAPCTPGSRQSYKHAVRVPVANAENPHIAVIAGIPQRRSKHLDVGESHAEYPDAQEDFHILPPGLRQPRAHDGHEEVQAHQHVYVPQGRGVIVEVEEERCKACRRWRSRCSCPSRCWGWPYARLRQSIRSRAREAPVTRQ